MSDDLVEKMAEAMYAVDRFDDELSSPIPWEQIYGVYRRLARAALAVVEESLGWEYAVAVEDTSTGGRGLAGKAHVEPYGLSASVVRTTLRRHPASVWEPVKEEQ